ncbi:MAG: Zn-ribbon domain-containing OB-fold protein [Actinobacteria bacterium]|nr:Zn-ribbon domain-containing OB-fold protein [Actinomycetota bacterium]
MEERPFSDISYRKYLDEDKFMGSRCRKCGQIYVPPRRFCLECRSEDMEWHELKGEGELAAYTCISIGPSFMIEEGYDRKNPYCTGVVTLAEGPRMVARIEGVDARDPESIKIGTPMKVEFLHRGEGDKARTFLAFRPL